MSLVVTEKESPFVLYNIEIIVFLLQTLLKTNL